MIDLNEARATLDELWNIATTEKTPRVDPNIERLVNSQFVAIRYCLPTQLLGKLIDSRLDCLCLQKGNMESDSSWDPRSFSRKVIAPWSIENQSVLGASSDPFVGKPLRRERLEQEPRNVKGKKEWMLLYSILSEVERLNDAKFTRLCMLNTLRSIYRKFSELRIEYPVPERISLEQVIELVGTFLQEPSGGDRILTVATALFQVFGKHFRSLGKYEGMQ